MSKKSLNDHKLIGLVQARKLIYDKTDRFYTSKSHNRDAWKEVANEMNTTVMACQKRWRYLRDYFVRQLHTHPDDRHSAIDSTTTNGKKRILWSLFDRLRFLAPFSSTRRGRSKAENYDYIIELPSSQQLQTDDLNSANSQSSNNSIQTSNDLNYIHLLQYQQQVSDYLKSAANKNVEHSPSEASDQQIVVDVDQYTDDEDEDDDVKGQFSLDANEQEVDEDDAILHTRPTQSLTNSLRNRTPSPVDTIKTIKQKQKRGSSIEAYGDLVELLRTKQNQAECDEHEHFFKSLLASVRKIDENHIMSFRTEVMQIVSKYLYMNQDVNSGGAREETGNIVVIETDKLHWRRNLSKYNRI